MKIMRLTIVATMAVVVSLAISIFLLEGARPQMDSAPRLLNGTSDRTGADVARQTNPTQQPAQVPQTRSPDPRAKSLVTAADESPSSKPTTARLSTDVSRAPVPSPEAAATKQLVAQTYDKMLSPDSHRVMQAPYVAAHALVEKENVDPNWSELANMSIGDNFLSGFGSRLDVSMVNCRTDICEVRVSSNFGNDYDADLMDVQNQLAAIKLQPWYQGVFDDGSFSVSFLDNQLPVMVIFFTRK